MRMTVWAWSSALITIASLALYSLASSEPGLEHIQLPITAPAEAAAAPIEPDSSVAAVNEPTSQMTPSPARPAAALRLPELSFLPAAKRRAALDIARPKGRLTAQDIGLVINTADPYSVQVGDYYIKARKLAPNQVLRVNVPVASTLNVKEFNALAEQINNHFGPQTQAIALAWSRPYAVECNSITGALTLGYNADLCQGTAGAFSMSTCAPSRTVSPYFNSPSSRPYTDLHIRPSMLLAARDVQSAIALINRGVAADQSLGLEHTAPVHAHFVITPDKVRSVRQTMFPPPMKIRDLGVEVHVDETPALENQDRVLMYMTGAVQVPKIETIRFVPGALADHLTSFGGSLDTPNGQMTVLSWIDVGATASYGTVTEPCAHWQKFPQPQVLLASYLQGSTALEAYWRSVAWPYQGLFVGEPLAAPFWHTARP